MCSHRESSVGRAMFEGAQARSRYRGRDGFYCALRIHKHGAHKLTGCGESMQGDPRARALYVGASGAVLLSSTPASARVGISSAHPPWTALYQHAIGTPRIRGLPMVVRT